MVDVESLFVDGGGYTLVLNFWQDRIGLHIDDTTIAMMMTMMLMMMMMMMMKNVIIYIQNYRLCRLIICISLTFWVTSECETKSRT